MYQKLILIGNIGTDAELRYTPEGLPVSTFTLATSKILSKTKDETCWFRVTLFGKRAEVLNNYLLKGASVMVEGRLKPGEGGNPRVYQRKDGTWSASFDVTASDVEFVGNKKGEVAPDIDVAF